MNTFRLLILGAGFSNAAGLPLASELFRRVRELARRLHGADNHLEHDLEYYVSFLRNTEGFTGSADDIDMEQFISFLDVEHYLQLKGSDTWSTEGNLAQLMIRHAIGCVLLDSTPRQVPEIYRQFASKLTTSDWVLTFNYDTLLEQALNSIDKPYRLFPSRYSEVGLYSATVDTSRDEVAILKLHGSIDWFDKTTYDQHSALAAKSPIQYAAKHPVFAPGSTITATPIVDGPRSTDDPLLQIYRVKEPSQVYIAPYWQCAPYLLSPSYSKLFYSRSLSELWSGMGQAGGLSLGFGVIGYSLPGYDDYARQAIYRIARNYQRYAPDLELDGRVKRPARILDHRPTDDAKKELRSRYQFLDTSRTEYWFDGLSAAAIEWFMA